MAERAATERAATERAATARAATARAATARAATERAATARAATARVTSNLKVLVQIEWVVGRIVHIAVEKVIEWVVGKIVHIAADKEEIVVATANFVVLGLFVCFVQTNFLGLQVHYILIL